ncbi:MAG TPA: hypothetical protein VGK31_02980 [Thermoanaerobaculia bacterium]
MKLRLSIMLVSAMFAGAAIAGEAETRAAFGTVRAQALDALSARLYPGSRLEWSPALAIVMADGSRRSLRVTDAVDREESDGSHTFVMPLEYPDEQTTAAVAIDALEPTTPVAMEIVAFKTNAQIAITDVHRAALPDTAELTTIVSIDKGANFARDVWPTVSLIYNGYYGTSEWVGQVEWRASFSTATMTITHRLPGFVGKVLKDGSTIIDAQAFIVPLMPNSFDIYSRDQRRFIMSCAVPCVPDGKVLLGLWGPISTTVAATP